jgi:hypothetical protein
VALAFSFPEDLPKAGEFHEIPAAGPAIIAIYFGKIAR